jgi:sugar phosphate isomerase/epimerase
MANTFSRRDFVRAGAAAGAILAGTGGAPAFAAAAYDPMFGAVPPSPIKLGIASYTFRNFSREILLANLKALKVSTLNCKDALDHLPMDPAAEDKAVAAYKASGIRITAAGTVTFDKDDDDDIRAKFEYLKRAAVPVVVAGGPTPEIIKRIEKFVKQYDIKFALHNHGPEDKMWHSPLDVLKVVGDMDPRIGCCIDVGHCARAGVNPVDAIRKVGPRVFDLHVKDLANNSDKESQVAVGDGVLPFREMFQALIDIKYQGYVDLEYEIFPDDPMPGVVKSFAYMRGVLAGMGYKG